MINKPGTKPNTKQDNERKLQLEILELRARLQESQETLQAARVERVGGLKVLGPKDDLTVILKCAVEPYRLMVDVMTEGAIACSADGTIIYCNASFAKLLNIQVEQVIGTKLQLFIAASDQSAFEALLVQSLRTAIRTQLSLKTPDEITVPVQCSTTPLKVGERLCVAAVFTDLSKVIAAAELKSRISMIVDSSEDAIISTTLDGIIESWNNAAEELFGYTAKEAIGKLVQRIIVPPERAGEIEQKLANVRHSIGARHAETKSRKKDGTSVDVSVATSPIHDVNGIPFGMSMILRDISEQKQHEEIISELNTRLEQRVKERTAQLESANRELEAFSYSISHDLRAPLRSLSGFSRILLEDHGQNLNEDGKDCLRRIGVATQRMSVLIDELLRLSRISRTQILYEPCDLTEMSEHIIDELKKDSEHRSVEVKIQKYLLCNGDRQLLLIMLQNLLRNAWKFTEKRENALLEIGCLDKNTEQIYFVRDNGAGFDMAYVDKLFGVFQRLHSNSEFEGIGIGLSIVKRIIERHNGRVWAEGEVDKGATFYFTIGSEPKYSPSNALVSQAKNE